MDHAAIQALIRQADLPELPSSVLEGLTEYGRLLVEWNQRVNLTRITEEKDIWIKHFIDSLLITRYFSLPADSTLIDIGTGAGFPAVPLKLLQPDIHITLLDSLQKRILFLQALCDALRLEANCLHARGEDAAHQPTHRESYGIATARAVAALPVLAEYCLGFVKVGGVFLALKGPELAEELAAAQSAIGKMGGAVEDIKEYSLPDGSRRSLIIIRKSGPTPPHLPRSQAKMAKAPL